MSSLDATGSAWEDVTELLGAAAKELKVGQLVHVPDFDLFDSMSALELMDPKMDAGLALHGAAPLAVRDRVARGTVPLAFASARDVLATVDELFRAEAAWLGGQPLAQTLLTCVYMHREAAMALLAQLVPPPQESQRDGSDHTERDDEDAEDAEDDEAMETRVRARLEALGGTPRETLLLVMAAVVAFTLRASAHVREVVVRADIYEEEDFSPGSAGQLVASPLADAGWSRSVLELLLTTAIDRLEKLLAQERARVAAKGSAKKANKKKGAKQSKDTAAATTGEAATAADQALEGLDANAKISALLCEALLRRLQLRRELHSVYSELGLAEKLADLERARSQFTAARELLKQIAAEALELDAECFSGKPFGFDKTLSRLLMSGSPPRDVKAINTDEAVKIYNKLLGDWLEACSPGDWTMMEQVRVFLADFSRRRPNIVARSFVLLLLYCEKKIYGRYSFMDWMTEEMVLNGVPSVLLSTQEGVQYSSRSIETVYESLKLYLHNRSRQRARIEYLLEEWAVLQLEAVAVDERFMSEMQIPKAAYPRYFTAWTLEQSTLLMIQYVLLGFELDLYAPNEYSTIYWYLDYLCGSRLQNLTFTWSFLERMKELMKGHPRRGGGAPSKPPATEDEATGEGSSDKPEDPAKARFEREIAYTEMLRAMMRAYFQAFAACEREERVNVAPPVYGSRVIRFQHRFAAFQSLHFPAALTYDDYLKNSDFSSFGVDLIYKSAEECFKVARGHGEELLSLAKTTEATAVNSIHTEETRDVLRAAVANLVELARHEQDQKVQTQQQGKRRTHKPAANAAAATPTTHAVVLDFSKHPHFPVMSISRSGDQERR